MTAPAAPGKTRSPNYPAIGLAEAIDRIKAIYAEQQRYPTTRAVLAQQMGYGSLNGASATILSALSKYGLLEGYGDNLRVSELGQDLVLHRKGDPEYTAALRTAAARPAFFQQLREQYPYGLPSEHSLRAALIKRGFNPKAIDGSVRAYRDTLEFVDAEIGDSTVESPEESLPEATMQTQLNSAVNPPPFSPPLSDPNLRSFMLPLSISGEFATLQVPFPLTEAAWDQMLAMLTAMRPALVAPAAVPPGESPPAIPEHIEPGDE